MGQSDPNIHHSAVVLLDAKRRFRVPRAILEALHWEAPNGPTQLVAEIVEVGRLRLWDKMAIDPRLAELEREIREGEMEDEDRRRSPADHYEALRAFQDRYRDLSLRPSDGRVQLPAILHSIVEANQEPTHLYVELGVKCMEVFSPQARIERLRRFRRETDLPEL